MLWPRHYEQQADAAKGETAFGAFVKVDRGGQVIVMVPQAELGQGVFTLFAQIVADELGADWRTVAVQPAPPGPVYANRLLAREWFDGPVKRAFGSWGDSAVDEYARRSSLMLTGGSTSVANFYEDLRKAGAAARVLLCMAAAARWDVAWEACDIVNGIVSDGKHKVRIGEIAHEAAGFKLPPVLPFRPDDRDDALVGSDAPRLDVPAKIDGSANYAADIRLPDMIYAAIRQGPVNAAGLKSIDEGAARKVQGMIGIVREQGWVAVTARNWWAANQALDRLDPVFTLSGPALDDHAIGKALDDAFAGDNGAGFFKRGDVQPVFDRAKVVRADYAVAPALHLPLEPMAATARVREGDVEVWMPTQAPVLARQAIAKALDVAESSVTVYPLFAGGSFGVKMEVDAGVQAALIARAARAPVQLLWSRSEDIIRDCPRPPAKARMTARLGPTGFVQGWSAKVAAPAALAQVWRRVGHGETRAAALASTAGKADALAVAGMDLPYAIPNFQVDHYPADIDLPAGRWRGNADSYGTFFSESFIDELAIVSGVEPLSFRIQMLGAHPRLVQCLTTCATLGGWQGGLRGSGQGIACHMMRGAYIAVLVEAGFSQGRVAVQRMVAVVDAGNQINPDIARQQIEGGLIFGLAAALGAAPGYRNSMPVAMRLCDYGLPHLRDTGDVMVEFLDNPTGDPIGVGEIGVPAVAPALASALSTISGKRYRQLPIIGKTA
ncbi:molybdopterin-dependent oxidoreductase [Sphingobium sp. H33]|uniref:Molybdopterin-dependent oxidoreductase n=2 Tax=Sphingobium nicotianae TaxID=2782607 RepID=A0A9X1DEG2_9SPHN|nr:molybdopterin-dependent oxidoreductase [Sphingobium nicotianae]